MPSTLKVLPIGNATYLGVFMEELSCTISEAVHSQEQEVKPQITTVCPYVTNTIKKYTRANKLSVINTEFPEYWA